MASFDCLPFDVIDYILNIDDISFADICRLASVSKIFNCISKSNKLWRKKYTQMWPSLASLYDAHNTDWRNEFRIRYTCRKLVSIKLHQLSVEFYHQENVSNDAFLDFKDIGRDHPLGYELVIDELENVINDPNSHLNLTHKYYAKRALRNMRHAQLEIVWRKFLAQPTNKLSLIEGACLISRWCQPTLLDFTPEVQGIIHAITLQVFQKVKELFPKHPVVKQGLLDSNEVFTVSLWPPRQCKNILYCINSVLYQDLKFSGSQIDYYCSENTFIDKVLCKKTGISLTLGIIYATVAGKLGVACLPVNFPGHFLLKWLEHPELTEKDAFTFIDVVENGAFKMPKELFDLVPGYPSFSPSWFDAVSPIKVFIKMAWYLVEFGRQLDGVGEDALSLCNALELLCLLSPDDLEHKLLLARLFMHLGINITEAISMLQEIASHNPTSPLILGYMYQSTLTTLETQKISRPPLKLKYQLRDESKDEVKFAVGMIMRHRKYYFRCVIYGWDYTCTASKDWIRRMGVYKLIFQDKQPFYYVLVEDGTNRYAAQENLKICLECEPITHVKIGRYFESFHGSYYLPNEQTAAEYPHDIAAREKALSFVGDV